MSKKQIFLFILGITISIYFLIITFRNFDLDQLFNYGDSINYFAIGSGIFLLIVSFSIRIYRWKVLLIQSFGHIKFSKLIGPFYISILANNILPFRLGDLIRILGFNHYLGISKEVSASSLVIERILDLLSLSLFSIIITYILSFDILSLKTIIPVICLIIIAIIIFLIYPTKILNFFLMIINQINTENHFKIALINFIMNVKTYLEQLTNNKIYLPVILISIISWGIEAISFYTISYSIPTLKNNLATLVAFVTGTLSTALPSAPGYIGTFDFAITRSLMAFGNDSFDATLYAIIVHLILWLTPVLIGVYYVFILAKKINYESIKNEK
mgnify:CR=1 FL=1